VSPRQAADTFRAVMNADPGDRDAFAGLGAAELALDDYVRARNAFQNALRLDPSDEAARKGLELARRVLELDPNAQGIRASERYARAKELLEGAATMLNQCLATGKDDPDLAANRELVNSASKAVAQHLSRGLDDAAEDDLTLALQVWRARQKLCGSEAARDEAMRRILTRMARE
jgi:Flp pilus assembly protein TadD